MPRQPRLVVAGYPHHIILRGNNRSAIFHNDRDRRIFITYLKDSKKKTESKIYAYCLMTNHVHLIVEPKTQGGLGEMMQSLGRKYVRYVNNTYGRTGTLWEGRFKSSLISKDEYLIACCRYVELNPVRARMVKSLGNYPWSSFKAKGEGGKDELIDSDAAYLSLGKSIEARRKNYRELILETIPEEEIKKIRLETQRNGIMGGREFTNKISKLLGRNVVMRPRGRPKKSL